MKVLITDVESRKGFDLVNIIQNALGFETILAAPVDVQFQLRVIYMQKVYPLNDSSLSGFASDLQSILQCFGAEDIVYMPVSEKYTKLFYVYLQENPQSLIKCLLPNEKYFNLCRDKNQFQQFCEDNNFPVPKSFTIDKILQPNWSFRPLVLKKRIGSGSVGLKYILNKEELPNSDSHNFEKYLIQERVKSDGIIHGAFFLCIKGKVISFHGHQRIRTFPSKGGVTVYSKSTVNPKLERLGADLLDRMNWSGLAMIEFMFDESTGEWKIIELNPRLWGSVLLSHFCESRIIVNYIKLSLKQAPTLSKAKEDRYIQWLFPFDFLNFIRGKIKLSELFSIKKKVCRVNISHSTFYRTAAYYMYFIFNISSLRRFFQKIGFTR